MPHLTTLNVCAFDFIMLSSHRLSHQEAYELWMKFHLDDRTEECECVMVTDPPTMHEYVMGYTVHIIHRDGYRYVVQFGRDEFAKACAYASQVYADSTAVMVEVVEG